MGTLVYVLAAITITTKMWWNLMMCVLSIRNGTNIPHRVLKYLNVVMVTSITILNPNVFASGAVGLSHPSLKYHLTSASAQR